MTMANLTCTEQLSVLPQRTLSHFWKEKKRRSSLGSYSVSVSKRAREEDKNIPEEQNEEEVGGEASICPTLTQSILIQEPFLLKEQLLCRNWDTPVSEQELYAEAMLHVQVLIYFMNRTIGVMSLDDSLYDTARYVVARDKMVRLIEQRFSVILCGWEDEELDERDVEWTTQFVVERHLATRRASYYPVDDWFDDEMGA